jgi:hypothetical protein
MKNLIKVLSLTAIISITVIACNEKKESKPDCDKPCCSTKADTEEIDSNNIILENEVVEDDII